MVGIIIFGVRGVKRKLDQGRFYCPSCQRSAPYTRYKVTRFFTLYFIPVIPLGSLGELVRCDQCDVELATEVLGYGHDQAAAVLSPWSCSQCGNVNPAEYSRCVSCRAPRPR
jgi:hypothetical protein